MHQTTWEEKRLQLRELEKKKMAGTMTDYVQLSNAICCLSEPCMQL
jgi:hypothetical protein